MPRISTLLLLICSLTVAVASAADSGIRVSNFESGTTVRHSVVLLRGTLEDGAEAIEIRNARTPKSASPIKPVVRNGQFKALIELSEGRNIVGLRTGAGAKPLLLELNYQPQTNPYYVRLVWMTDNTGDTTFAAPNESVPQDYAARLRTAALLMQTFTADRMHELGYGRRTFRLERDADGQVIVHTLKAPHAADHYYAIGDNSGYWAAVGRWLNREHPAPKAKNIVLAAFTRKDPETGKMKGHTALGGGNLGLFGSASVFSWPRNIADAAEVFLDNTKVDPSKVHDDSAGRGTNWGLASTTIGATLHEMGHTFGLPHCTDGRCIMTRGFDRFNRFFALHDPPSRRGFRATEFRPDEEAYFARISASYLRWSLWFSLDEVERGEGGRPSILIDKADKRVVVEAESGVRWVGFWVGGDIHAFQEFGDGDTAPTKVELSFDEIGEKLGRKALSKVTTIATDGKSAAAQNR